MERSNQTKSVHFINLVPCVKAIWKGDMFSLIPFTIQFPLEDKKSIFHSEGTVSRVSAYLEIKQKSGDIAQKQGRLDGSKHQNGHCSIFPCARMDVSEILMFDFNKTRNHYYEKEITLEKQLKLNSIFLRCGRDKKSVVARIDRELLDDNFESFVLILTVEMKAKPSHYPQSMVVENQIKVEDVDDNGCRKIEGINQALGYSPLKYFTQHKDNCITLPKNEGENMEKRKEQILKPRSFSPLRPISFPTKNDSKNSSPTNTKSNKVVNNSFENSISLSSYDNNSSIAHNESLNKSISEFSMYGQSILGGCNEIIETLPKEAAIERKTSKPNEVSRNMFIEGTDNETYFVTRDNLKEYECHHHHHEINSLLHGRSDSIIILEYKLSIEEKFSKSSHVQRIGDDRMFEWYCKYGGENAEICVQIHCRDSTGGITDLYPVTLEVETELVYDDGTPAPLLPHAPLKERRNSIIKKCHNRLYRPMRPDPTFYKGLGYKGFKLKVSPKNRLDILPGLMNETIVVKSKPKIQDDEKIKRQKGGRTTLAVKKPKIENFFIDNNNEKEVLKDTSYPFRRFSVAMMGTHIKQEFFNESVDSITKQNNNNRSVATVPIDKLSILFTGYGSCCLFCKAELGSSSGLCPSVHKMDCRLSLTLAPAVVIRNILKESRVINDNVGIMPLDNDVDSDTSILSNCMDAFEDIHSI